MYSQLDFAVHTPVAHVLGSLVQVKIEYSICSLDRQRRRLEKHFVCASRGEFSNLPRGFFDGTIFHSHRNRRFGRNQCHTSHDFGHGRQLVASVPISRSTRRLITIDGSGRRRHIAHRRFRRKGLAVITLRIGALPSRRWKRRTRKAAWACSMRLFHTAICISPSCAR